MRGSANALPWNQDSWKGTIQWMVQHNEIYNIYLQYHERENLMSTTVSLSEQLPVSPSKAEETLDAIALYLKP